MAAPSRVLKPALALLWRQVDAHTKRWIALTIILAISSSVLTSFAPVVLSLLIDAVEKTDGTSLHAVGPLIVAYAGALWMSRAMGELRNFLYARTDQRVQRGLSQQLFQHVMSLPLPFHLDRKTGALSQILTNGLLGYRMLEHHLMLTALPIMIELITIFVILSLLGHELFLAVIGISVLLYAVAFSMSVARIRYPARGASNAHVAANAILTDSILNYETVKYFCAEAHVQRRFVNAVTETEERWGRLFRCKMENGVTVVSIFTISVAATAYFAAIAVQRGTISIGEFVLVNSYILQITKPMEMVGFAFRDLAQAMTFIEKLIELFAQKQELEDSGDSHVRLAPGPSAIKFEKVSYCYRSDRSILKNISFSIAPGKTVAIVGVSGSGKSSIVRLLVRLIEPTHGLIRFDDVPLSELPVSTVRAAIAVVPQDVQLFNESIAYNIAIGSFGASKSAITRAAEIAQLHEFVISLPHGYETKVGERGLKLSGGEKQRLAIARAAIKQPKLIVFDEATSSLDSATEQAVLQSLNKIRGTMTTIVIAHRLSTVAEADEIIVLEKGRVVEHGPHDELLKRTGSYAAMWRTQHIKNLQIDRPVSAM